MARNSLRISLRIFSAIAVNSRLIDHNRTLHSLDRSRYAPRSTGQASSRHDGGGLVERPVAALRGRAPPGAGKTDAVRARRRDGGNRRSTAYCRVRPAILLTVFMRPRATPAKPCRALCSSMAAAWSPAASTPMIASRRRWRRPPAAASFRWTTGSRPSTNFRPRSRTRSRRPDGCRSRPPRSASIRQSWWSAAIPPARRSPRWCARSALRNAGPAISAQCLICPVLDFEDISPSREEFAENHLLDRPRFRPTSPTICPRDADLADPRISPLRAVKFAGLPAAIIHTAEFDPMRDEGNAYAGKLVAAGVDGRACLSRRHDP